MFHAEKKTSNIAVHSVSSAISNLSEDVNASTILFGGIRVGCQLNSNENFLNSNESHTNKNSGINLIPNLNLNIAVNDATMEDIYLALQDSIRVLFRCMDTIGLSEDKLKNLLNILGQFISTACVTDPSNRKEVEFLRALLIDSSFQILEKVLTSSVCVDVVSKWFTSLFEDKLFQFCVTNQDSQGQMKSTEILSKYFEIISAALGSSSDRTLLEISKLVDLEISASSSFKFQQDKTILSVIICDFVDQSVVSSQMKLKNNSNLISILFKFIAKR